MTTYSAIPKIVNALIVSLFVTCLTTALSLPAMAAGKTSKGSEGEQPVRYMEFKFQTVK